MAQKVLTTLIGWRRIGRRFNAGVFIGAGPWFHGAHEFQGHVDNRFDPHHGYKGPHPERGDKPFNHFHGNEMRDGRGHASGGHAGGGHR